MKNSYRVLLNFVSAIGISFIFTPVFANSIGEITTTDGTNYKISRFGSTTVDKSYFIKTEKKFVSINEVSSIAKINTDAGRFVYLIVLNDGSLESGRQGLLFYENVSFTDPGNGKLKSAFTPVIKDRQQDGLIMTVLTGASDTEKVIEFTYPNNIDKISLNKTHRFVKNRIVDNIGEIYTSRVVEKDSVLQKHH